MTRITYIQEKNKQAMPISGIKPIDSEEVIYLKRLLVTIKLQFEKKLHALNHQLQEEISKNHLLSKELQNIKAQTDDVNLHHEEELKSLRDQLLSLKDLVKKTQEAGVARTELKDLSDLNQQEDHDRETWLEEAEKKQNRINELEFALEKERAEHSLELERLNEKLAFYKDQDDQHELITSNTSSYQLRQELEFIKQTLVQGAQEAKTLEIRYADLFNEKMTLDHRLKVLNEEFNNLTSSKEKIQAQLDETTEKNQALQTMLGDNEKHLLEEIKIQHELSDQVLRLEGKCLELAPIQEKYEQLKDEFLQINSQLDEMIELRVYVEKQYEQMQALSQDREVQLTEKCLEIESFIQEREHLLADIEHLHHLLSESESNLKTAQQHLAKKVKESAMLIEKVEEHQNDLTQYMQIIENDKSQIIVLQTDLESYQRQEKVLREQLHEALKATENQVAKWEKKYFEMYDKWQVSENQIRELKKLEEKHLQMQNLLSNLGNYMGPSFSPNQLFQAMTSASNGDGKQAEFLFNPLSVEEPNQEPVEKSEEHIPEKQTLFDASGIFNDN